MPIFFVEKICEAFAKASRIYSIENISVFGYKIIKKLNEPVKLTML